MIFSICKIGNFSETTDCLLDEIVVFVNQIVKIIHQCAKQWDGIPTNNNGDRYMLSWKIPTTDDVKNNNLGDGTKADPNEEQPILSTANN